jgi:hypothetical protein
MNNEFNITGHVSKDGKLFISGLAELNDVLSKHKNAKVVGELRFYENGSTEAMIGYYYGKMLPDIQRAYFELGNQFSIEDTDIELRSNCPMMWFSIWNSELQKKVIVLKIIQSLSREQLKAYIAWVQQFASENLRLVLTD